MFTVLPGPDLPHQDVGVPGLIRIWGEAMADFRSAVASAGPDGWDLPTPCPGWSIGDVMAHVSSLERAQLGETDPPHEPPWDALPHVTDDFGRLTEIPVDLRRSWPRDEVIAEFDRTIPARRAALEAGPQDTGAKVENPFGHQVPIDPMLRTRIFDTWAHEQDVVAAAHLPDMHLDSAPAWIAAGRMVNALSYVWAKKVDAPPDTTAFVRVDGPGIAFTATTARRPDQRGVLVDPVAAPTTTVTTSWPVYVALCCGRITPEQAAGDVEIGGEESLGRALVARLEITP